ncbi:MAG: lytic transglycosylase domain-containing protein [Nitrospirae bacterium]|nr:lytic transglycosylase domain-containing protein [Nitrospirota bacterium]
MLYRQMSLFPYSLLILVAMVSIALTYAFTVPDGPADTHFSYASFFGSSKDAKETARQAVLQWMKENSDMPDHVLANIYTAASATSNRDLILAICLVESNFNPHVESDKGAIGLMGIMPGVWLDELKEQGIVQEKDDLYKISSNIAAGAHVLATYQAETNDLRKALIRYVGGASWYATRVLQAQKKIKMAQSPEQQLALAAHD